MAARRKKTRKARPARRTTKRRRQPRARRAQPRRKRAAQPRRKRAAKPRRKRAAKPRAKRATRRRAKPSRRPNTRERPQPARAARPRRRSDPGGQPLVAGTPIEVGVVLHYYAEAVAGVVALSRPIHRGDVIHVRGRTTDFVQPVEELRLEGALVTAAAPPQQIGVRLAERARAGDRVYRVSW